MNMMVLAIGGFDLVGRSAGFAVYHLRKNGDVRAVTGQSSYLPASLTKANECEGRIEE